MLPKRPSFMSVPETRLLFFGGKGGVGKTTLAAATALHWAGQDAQKKILIASTDPAHSLGDSLNQSIGDTITPVAQMPNLFALEFDSASRLEKFRQKYDVVMKKILDRGTYFDLEDIAQFFDLSLPGLDELMAVIEIAGIVRDREYDLVILDTAPTGHTLRMLSLPHLMEHWIEVLDLMLAKHRYMVSTFGKYHLDDTDAFLNLMRANLAQLETVLRDPIATAFVPVMIPETMCIEETGRLMDGLKALHIRVATILVNRVVMPSVCQFCAERYREQGIYLAEIQRKFPSLQMLKIPLLSHEARGQADLLDIGRMLRGEAPGFLPGFEPAAGSSIALQHPSLPGTLLPTRLILFGGKGGVGKTTIATATAIFLASTLPGKTLLFSTDPAHSLSDSLAQQIGNKVTQVNGVPQLFAIEMNSTDLLDDFNRTYVEEMDEVFNSFLSGTFSIEFDRQVMAELVSLTPPGLDELMALMKIMEFIDTGQFDHYVLDLAPTGHALRFLETPIIVRQWFITFFKLLLKYQGIASLHKAAELLRQESKQLRKVQQYLLDPGQCQFVTVTIAEAMAVLETKRLLKRLAELKISCNLVVTNMLAPANDCPFCATLRAGQQTYLDEIDGLLPGRLHLNLQPAAIQGFEKLTLVVNELFGGQDD